MTEECCPELRDLLSPKFFKALSEPNRLCLLTHLSESGKELRVSDLTECCSVDLSVISRHLGMLRDAGILEANKRGKEVFYKVKINELATFLRNLADALENCCPGGCCISSGEAND
jgi:ArsR family transcriptional regulator, arsenate/arsenite/antimonite-responsive transcriptional repressor